MWGTLVDEIVVQAAKQSLGSALAQGLAGSVGSGLGSAIGQGMFSNLKFTDPELQKAAEAFNAQKQPQQQPAPQQQPQTAPQPTAPTPPAADAGAGARVTPTAPGGTTVEELVVTAAAPRAAPALANFAPAGALGAVVGAGLRNPITGSTYTAPDSTLSEELVVTPAAQAGAGQLSPVSVLTAGLPQIGRDQLISPANPSDLQQPEPPTLDQPQEGMDGKDKALAAAAAGGGLGLLGGLSMRDLIAGGLLGAGLLANGKGGGDAKEAQEGLKDLAEDQKEMAGRLANIANAGMMGNIGGMGMNSIARMVRKAQAAIRQRYSSMGMSGSTAEQQDLQAAAEAGVDLQFKIGQDMAKTGLMAVAALSGQSAQAYLALMNAATAKDTQLGNALANFAGALVR